MTLAEGLQVLRLDAGYNDDLVQSLLDGAPNYIETATGLKIENQGSEPLCQTVTGFLLKLWYFGDKADDVALNRTIDSLLKSIKAKAAATE